MNGKAFENISQTWVKALQARAQCKKLQFNVPKCSKIKGKNAIITIDSDSECMVGNMTE